MKVSRVLDMKDANDPVLNTLATSWKSNRATERNPVIEVEKLDRVRDWLWSIAVVTCAVALLGKYIGAHPLLIAIVFLVGALGFILLAKHNEESMREAHRFLSALSLVEKNWDLLTGLEPVDPKDIDRRLGIGEKILRPKADEIKALQSIGWRDEEAKQLKARFTETHTQLASLGLAHKDHACYWR